MAAVNTLSVVLCLGVPPASSSLALASSFNSAHLRTERVARLKTTARSAAFSFFLCPVLSSSPRTSTSSSSRRRRAARETTTTAGKAKAEETAWLLACAVCALCRVCLRVRV
jgi:hypothetical protein